MAPAEQPVGDDAAVHQEELIPGGGNIVIRAGDETGDPQSRSGQIQGQHLVGPFQPQEGGQPFLQVGMGRGLEQGLALGLHLKMDFRVAQGQVAHEFQDPALLRGLGTQKFPAGRGIVKQVQDTDLSPGRSGPDRIFPDLAPFDGEAAAQFQFRGAGA